MTTFVLAAAILSAGTYAFAQAAPAAAASSGKYGVQMDYACDPGSTFAVQVDGKDTGGTATVAQTAGWGDYKTVTLDGTLSLTSGTHTVRLLPLTKPGLAVMNLRRLTLRPVK